MVRNALPLFSIVLLLSAGAMAQDTKPADEPRPTPSPEITKANQRPAETSPAEPFDKADVKTMAAQCVRFDTDAGTIEIELFPESAPETVRNFLNLVATGLYDTTTFGRVVPGFVVQGGNIWSREGGVNFAIGTRARRTIRDEPNKIVHERGILSMARPDEPNAATTSFFILVDAATHLDGTFTAFGRVTKGMEVVDSMNKAKVTDEKPENQIKLKKASVYTCPATP